MIFFLLCHSLPLCFFQSKAIDLFSASFSPHATMNALAQRASLRVGAPASVSSGTSVARGACEGSTARREARLYPLLNLLLPLLLTTDLSPTLLGTSTPFRLFFLPFNNSAATSAPRPPLRRGPSGSLVGCLRSRWGMDSLSQSRRNRRKRFGLFFRLPCRLSFFFFSSPSSSHPRPCPTLKKKKKKKTVFFHPLSPTLSLSNRKPRPGLPRRLPPGRLRLRPAPPRLRPGDPQVVHPLRAHPLPRRDDGRRGDPVPGGRDQGRRRQHPGVV